MNRRTRTLLLFLLGGCAFVAAPSEIPGQPEKKEPEKKGPPFGFGPPGGFGGPMGQVRQVVKQFDKDGDGRLNKEERKAARAFVKKEGGGRGPGGFRPGGKGGFPPGGKGGFAPGDFLTRPLVEALDSDRDGKLTKAEL